MFSGLNYEGALDSRGDFNTVKARDENVGVTYNQASMNALQDFIENAGLVDLSLKGSKFTWRNYRESVTPCRLDRILVSPELIQLFPGAGIGCVLRKAKAGIKEWVEKDKKENQNLSIANLEHHIMVLERQLDGEQFNVISANTRDWLKRKFETDEAWSII
ncbi:hypothetical protein V6N13_020793 [Hibiscus sabdariffa]